MSLSQTSYLAQTARKKLRREGSRANHDLRMVVGHANFLHSLIIELAKAEEQFWVSPTVNNVAKGSQHSSLEAQAFAEYTLEHRKPEIFSKVEI
ncbi:hypothetical protein N7520_002315 [Penicillium odoratum]|uniref:uncharacterized protein n=1 Tax=Penicillium odoratum TaxID=1167516 RepID=UPI0025484FA3|nr:uncharacterized protein N7520_002315 [Penicillium odoratum]KAJ5771786.1 hypothetical protein N7520_002315 [Penicillium odoratum]